MKKNDLPRFRLLPLTISCMALMLLSKTFELYTGSHLLMAGEAYAKAEAQDAPKETSQAANNEDSSEKSDNKSEKKKDSEDEKKLADVPIEDPVITRQTQFSPVEVDLLQSLAARRDKLNEYEEEIKLKASLLDATEVRLDRKIEEIQTMESGLKKLIDQYNGHEEAEIRSLVKIYENMKPKDAAQIFDEMELPILLLVVDKMSERKAAAVLALMSPVKAKNLTVELADQRKIRDALTQQSMSAPPAPKP
ncbi:MAG: hypothetical protein K2Q12_07755 [Rickettsiales bacterium]|nr:hypothetical protein [Rickettsiales bacterium]